jgi:hypothetical protein
VDFLADSNLAVSQVVFQILNAPHLAAIGVAAAFGAPSFFAASPFGNMQRVRKLAAVQAGSPII